MFGALVGGSLTFTLFGAVIIFSIRLVFLHRQASQIVMGVSLMLIGTLLGALILGGVGNGGICLVTACYDSHLIGALYGMLTSLPLIFVRPSKA